MINTPIRYVYDLIDLFIKNKIKWVKYNLNNFE